MSNTGNKYYYALGGRLIGTLHGTSSLTTNFLLTDTLGSVISTFSNVAGSAAVQGNQGYGPYGSSRYSKGSITSMTAKGFTGQYADDLTGFDYYVARYYDPVSARFLQADIVQGNLMGMDPYDYVGGNPETRNDPTGRCWPWCTALIGAAAGALIGGGAVAITQLATGHSVNWGDVGKGALIGAAAGAVIGVVGPLVVSAAPAIAASATAGWSALMSGAGLSAAIIAAHAELLAPSTENVVAATTDVAAATTDETAAVTTDTTAATTNTAVNAASTAATQRLTESTIRNMVSTTEAQTTTESGLANLTQDSGRIWLGSYKANGITMNGVDYPTGGLSGLHTLEDWAGKYGGKLLSDLPGTIEAMIPEIQNANQIVFNIGRNGFRPDSLTGQEYLFILQHPEILRRTIFVFGATY